MLISGSSVLNPSTKAAALLTRLLEFIISMTGASRAFAILAVLPISLTESIPSYNPRTPSITAMSLSFQVGISDLAFFHKKGIQVP